MYVAPRMFWLYDVNTRQLKGLCGVDGADRRSDKISFFLVVVYLWLRIMERLYSHVDSFTPAN